MHALLNNEEKRFDKLQHPFHAENLQQAIGERKKKNFLYPTRDSTYKNLDMFNGQCQKHSL